MGDRTVIKTGQEQAVAAWINYLNQDRLNCLKIALGEEEKNLSAALSTIDETLKKVDKEIIKNGKGRGGKTGMHGFIAEVAECGVENARKQIEGEKSNCIWIDDNGPVDILRGATPIQQKFFNSGGHLSLQAIQSHMKHYPDFLDNGGVYQIPEDHYEKIRWYLSIPKEKAEKMPTSTGEFSLRQWKEVHDFFDGGKVPLNKVEPSKLKYDQVQKGTYEKTLNQEENSLKERNQQRRTEAYEKSKPTFAEGAKASAVSGGIEGLTSFGMAIIEKKKSGKKIADFDSNDWKEIAGDTGKGALKGSVRGASIYWLTNYTATPAAVANALVTASFGIAEQAHLLRIGELDELGFIENSEMLCLDAAVSALSSFVGQVVFPVPVIGAVIGNTVGTMMYQISKDYLSDLEQKLIKSYVESINRLNLILEKDYQIFVQGINNELLIFMDLLDRAFVPDIHLAFVGSVDLAKACGVPTEEILDSKEKIVSYFMD